MRRTTTTIPSAAMKTIVAIYGSPRRSGNTAALLDSAVAVARETGAGVEEIVLRDRKISPCLEIYHCRINGECAIRDDFQKTRDRLLAADGIILASPIFFYTVSAHVKMLMDRCQSLWVAKYWRPDGQPAPQRRRRAGMFISVGATRGKRLFEGTLLTVRYFFDALDVDLHETLLYRGLDFEGDVLKQPGYLDEARKAGHAFARDVLRGDAM